MRVNLVNRKTGKAEQIDFRRMPLLKIKQVVGAAACSSHYFVYVVAVSPEEIDFISSRFTNIPLPDISAKSAVWSGDLAIFIIMNFPSDFGKNSDEENSNNDGESDGLRSARQAAGFEG